jgi:hypothetical protein
LHALRLAGTTEITVEQRQYDSEAHADANELYDIRDGKVNWKKTFQSLREPGQPDHCDQEDDADGVFACMHGRIIVSRAVEVQ